jgi:hypothetical protein
MVVVDRMTKLAHFIPASYEIDALETADLFLKHVFSAHGLPDEIISDRGRQFTSGFWTRLMELCDVKRNLSTAYHPETDGQTERTNQVLEQYLRIYCDYQQDDWARLLPLAEFAYNNSEHSATGVSPFYATYGYHPEFNVTIRQDESKNETAETLAEKIQTIQSNLKDKLQQAQERYKKYYDRKIMDVPDFRVGDKVWLIRKNIKTTRPTSKLDYKRLGPYTITAEINPRAYRLALPKEMKIHNVFHVSLLEKYDGNRIPGRIAEPSPAVEVEGQEEWIVRRILDSRRRYGRLEYRVDWDGYGPEDWTWEPATNLSNAPEAVQDFYQRYPNKPRY